MKRYCWTLSVRSPLRLNIIIGTFDILHNCIDSFWSLWHPPLLCCLWSSSLKPENSNLKQDEKNNGAMNSLHRLHPLRTQASLTNTLSLNYIMYILKLDNTEGAI